MKFDCFLMLKGNDSVILNAVQVMRVITRKVVGKFFELLKTLIKNDSTALAAHKAAVKEAQEKGESKPPAPVTNYTKFWKGFQKNIQVGCSTARCAVSSWSPGCF